MVWANAGAGKVGSLDDLTDLHWLDAGEGYALALAGSGLVARNAAGRVLRSVPAALRDAPLAVRLRELSQWLERHERTCADQVETWMVRSLPVPLGVLVECWPDPAWRRAAENSVVAVDRDLTGFLRGADPDRGIGIVTPDGETGWSRAPAFRVPHPILLEDLDDLREFATELQVEQVIPQLYRETWDRPRAVDPDADRVDRFAGAAFPQQQLVTVRARGLGFTVSGGSAVTRTWEDGRLVEARFWIGSEAPELETTTGDLIWVEGGRQLRLSDVGPVAYSEGMRMAAALHAGGAAQEGGEE